MQKDEEWMSFGKFCEAVLLPTMQALTIALIVRLIWF